jgi:methionyl-tRNA synthetase
MTRYMVTSALPYANGPLHLGHLAGAYLPADIYVRFLRSKGCDVVYICGTDEHGVPITITAEKMGMTPREVVDRYYRVIAEDFESFGISFDNFSRTSKPEHAEFAQDVFLKLLEKGYIEEHTMEQLFCSTCSRFLPDRYIKGTCPKCDAEGARGDQCEECGSWLEALELVSPACSICGSEPEPRETRHWFLKLDMFQDWLSQWLKSHSDWKDNVLNYCRGWLDEGLRERAITRDLDWGIPVPIEGAEGKVLYVWFEALLGYVSSTREYFSIQGRPDDWEKYWKDDDSRLIHFIGKDNIVFHAIIEPSVLHGLGDFVLPWNVPANEFLNISGRKQSTSRGTAVWMGSYLEHFKPDPMRYALTINSPENRDTDFSWEEFRVRNNELADVLGNFVNRTMKFAFREFDGKIPPAPSPGPDEEALITTASDAAVEIDSLLSRFRLKAACAAAMVLAREGNRYFDQAQPWKTAKSDPDRCAVSIHYCLQLMDTLRIVFSPFIPFSCEAIGKMLGSSSTDWSLAGRLNLSAGEQLGTPEILFTKLEEGFYSMFESDDTDTDGDTGEEESVPVTFDEFMRIDLRVGLITEVHDIDGAEKLFRIVVDMGTGTRQLVAGLKPWYSAEDLVGRKTAVVCNLEPATIRGVESSGMVLASDGAGGVRLVEPDPEALPGDRIR